MEKWTTFLLAQALALLYVNLPVFSKFFLVLLSFKMQSANAALQISFLETFAKFSGKQLWWSSF